MALAPVRPFRAWDFGDHVGVRVALDKAPHSTHPDWTQSALAWVGIKHVRTNAQSAAAVVTIKRLYAALGVRFHFTAFAPPKTADKATTEAAAVRRIDWVTAQGLKAMTTSVESFNEWDSNHPTTPPWRDQLRWAQAAMWAKRAAFRAG